MLARISRTFFFFVIGIAILTSALSVARFAAAWSGPSSSPPNSNASAPVNVGSTDQTKNASLGVNGLAVFGNSLLQASAYLNWGSTAGTSGYGIWDNAGTLNFKSSGGSWQSLQAIVASLSPTGLWTTSGSNIYSANAGNVGINQSSPSTKLDIGRANDTLVNVQTALGSNSMGISTTYGAGSNYVGGHVWYDTDNNATKPKAGMWMYQDGTGSFIQLGTSNNFATGITNQAISINPSGNLGVGVPSPATKVEVAANTAIKLGNAYLSSGGDYAHLANNEWYNGSAWTTNGSAGEMLQLTGQAMNVYSHDTSGVNTQQMSINTTGVGIKTASPNTGLQLGAGGDGLANGLTVYSTYPTIYFRHAAGYRSAMIHVNANVMYFLTAPTGAPDGGNNWATVANGYWPLYINLTNNDAVFGGNVYAFAFLYLSDKKLKENIQPLDEGLVTLMKLKPVSFTWKKDAPMAGKRDMGFIAQEVEQILPGIVNENDKGQKTIDYVRLTPVLVNAVQQQQKRIEELKAELENLKTQCSLPKNN